MEGVLRNGWTRQDQADAARLMIALEARKAAGRLEGRHEFIADGICVMERGTARKGKTRPDIDGADRPPHREDCAEIDLAGLIGSTLPVRIGMGSRSPRPGEHVSSSALRAAQGRRRMAMNDNRAHVGPPAYGEARPLDREPSQNRAWGACSSDVSST